jgi:hypothetical protein
MVGTLPQLPQLHSNLPLSFEGLEQRRRVDNFTAVAVPLAKPRHRVIKYQGNSQGETDNNMRTAVKCLGYHKTSAFDLG